MGDSRLDEANRTAGRVLDPCGEYLDQPDEVDAARAGEYAVLALLLARAPDAVLLARIAKLHGDATPLGVAHASLAQAAAGGIAETIAREFFDLFIGVGRGELLPYGSYYLTGFLNERPLARLREDLQALGIERVEGQCEPEDHAAILCEVMADSFLRQSSGNARSSRSISLRGSDAFSLTLRSPTLPTSIAMSVLLDGYLSRSKRRHSRCPGERARKDRRARYESARQAELGASSILSRPRRRYGGRRGRSARPWGCGRYREPR